MLVTCECGTEFQAKRPSARYCSARCRKRAQRRPGGVEAPVRVLPRPSDGLEGDVTAAAREELRSAGRDSTAAGQLVLALARRIDAGEGETGASLAALVKEFRAAMSAAVAGAVQAADPLDELRMRRDGKRSG